MNSSATPDTVTIHIHRLALQGRHGVLPQERVVGAMFYVSLDIDSEVSSEALLHDRLSGTISYADIIERVRQEMSVPSPIGWGRGCWQTFPPSIPLPSVLTRRIRHAEYVPTP